MFKTLLAAAFACFVASAANAQDNKASVNDDQARPVLSNIKGVPDQFVGMASIYDNWKPEYKEEPFANSIYNWATHARQEHDSLKRDAFLNWVFTRSETTFFKIARDNASLMKRLFGNLYLGRGVGIVFTKEYDSDADGLYTGWYDCIAKTEYPVTDGRKEAVGEKEVLAWINWGDGHDGRTMGIKGSCEQNFDALSQFYGSSELSVDDVMSIGFLHRRYVAHLRNPKFIGADSVRQIISEIFDAE